jgi:hypothetical protein
VSSPGTAGGRHDRTRLRSGTSGPRVTAAVSGTRSTPGLRRSARSSKFLTVRLAARQQSEHPCSYASRLLPPMRRARHGIRGGLRPVRRRSRPEALAEAAARPLRACCPSWCLMEQDHSGRMGTKGATWLRSSQARCPCSRPSRSPPPEVTYPPLPPDRRRHAACAALDRGDGRRRGRSSRSVRPSPSGCIRQAQSQDSSLADRGGAQPRERDGLRRPVAHQLQPGEAARVLDVRRRGAHTPAHDSLQSGRVLCEQLLVVHPRHRGLDSLMCHGLWLTRRRRGRRARARA